jgi:hypothetical protein
VTPLLRDRLSVVRLWTATIVVPLILAIGIIEPAHSHKPASAVTNGHCVLCMVGHTTVPVASLSMLPVRATAEFQPPTPDFENYGRLHCNDLFIRPPPQA